MIPGNPSQVVIAAALSATLPADSKPTATTRPRNELWNELHHQGDLGEVSYLALVELTKIRATQELPSDHLLGLASTIEVERHRRTNPPMPPWLVAEYRGAWQALLEVALEELKVNNDPQIVQVALAAVALAKGLRAVGAAVWYHDDGTLIEYLDERLDWTQLYENKAG